MTFTRSMALHFETHHDLIPVLSSCFPVCSSATLFLHRRHEFRPVMKQSYKFRVQIREMRLNDISSTCAIPPVRSDKPHGSRVAGAWRRLTGQPTSNSSETTSNRPSTTLFADPNKQSTANFARNYLSAIPPGRNAEASCE
jgi:hypothetical protein